MFRTLVALAFLPVALSNGWFTGVLQALNASGLDQFANATASLNGTTFGQSILTQLFQGDKTIFVPTDGAWSNVDSAIINNETSLADVISYHIVSGNFVNQTETFPNVTIGRTLLNDSNLVTLEGNESQVLVWSKFDNGSFFVLNQGSNITVVNTTSYNNTAILAIDSVLNPPPNISTVLNNATYNLTIFAAFLNSTTLPNGLSLFDALSSAHGVTVFAPDNAGVQAAQGSLSGLINNKTALLNVFSNHVINGTSVYSTEIPPKTAFVSSGGQDFAFFTNSTGQFVSVGGSNEVQIMTTNVLTSNGVMHVVNGVMLDTNSNAAAASSAFASATSVAAQTSSETGAVSSPTTSTSAAGSVKGGADSWKLGVLAGVALGFGRFA